MPDAAPSVKETAPRLALRSAPSLRERAGVREAARTNSQPVGSRVRLPRPASVYAASLIPAQWEGPHAGLGSTQPGNAASAPRHGHLPALPPPVASPGARRTTRPSRYTAREPERMPQPQTPPPGGSAQWQSHAPGTPAGRRRRQARASGQAAYPGHHAPHPRSRRADHGRTGRRSLLDRPAAPGSAPSSPRQSSRRAR